VTDVTLTQQDTDTELAKMRTDKAASPGELSPRLLLEINHEISYPLFALFRNMHNLITCK